MLHAKTIVADARWVRIGSSNLNPSSLLGNYELDVLIEDPALAEAMERQFRLDIARSREVTRRRVRGPRPDQRGPADGAGPRRAGDSSRPAAEESPRDPPPRGRGAPDHRQQRPALGVPAPQRPLHRPGPSLLRLTHGFTAYVFGALCAWLRHRSGPRGLPAAGRPLTPPRPHRLPAAGVAPRRGRRRSGRATHYLSGSDQPPALSPAVRVTSIVRPLGHLVQCAVSCPRCRSGCCSFAAGMPVGAPRIGPSLWPTPSGSPSGSSPAWSRPSSDITTAAARKRNAWGSYLPTCQRQLLRERVLFRGHRPGRSRHGPDPEREHAPTAA